MVDVTKKVVAITGGTLKIGAQGTEVDFEIESGELKYEFEKIPFTPNGGDGWEYQIPGGKKKATGSIKGFCDTDKMGARDVPHPSDGHHRQLCFQAGNETN